MGAKGSVGTCKLWLACVPCNNLFQGQGPGSVTWIWMEPRAQPLWLVTREEQTQRRRGVQLALLLKEAVARLCRERGFGLVLWHPGCTVRWPCWGLALSGQGQAFLWGQAAGLLISEVPLLPNHSLHWSAAGPSIAFF